MKKTIQLFFTASLLSLCTIPVYAQGGPGGPMGGPGMQNPEQRIERQTAMMQDSLELSEDLTEAVKEVLTVYSTKMQEARAEANGDWSAMRSTMQTLRQEQGEELAAIVGEEKWAQWETITANMMERRQEARSRRPGNRGNRGNRNGKKKDGGNE